MFIQDPQVSFAKMVWSLDVPGRIWMMERAELLLTQWSTLLTTSRTGLTPSWWHSPRCRPMDTLRASWGLRTWMQSFSPSIIKASVLHKLNWHKIKLATVKTKSTKTCLLTLVIYTRYNPFDNESVSKFIMLLLYFELNSLNCNVTFESKTYTYLD